ncbi:GrpB domain protein [Thozetella sp. PMI_491]|nr:GrpB domain protein [Thozetella sp. PMI_491]
MTTATTIKSTTEYSDVPTPDQIQRVSFRVPRRIEIVEPDPAWPAQFAQIASLIRGALGDAALSIDHVGSTSVPGLPAKPVIDVDLVVRDAADEATYVPALEAAGLQLLYREPLWYEHRFFGLAEPYANVHVFGTDSPEPKRHAMFREWLKEHPDDSVKYATVKRAAAEASEQAKESVNQYNARKAYVIQEILARISHAHGLVSDDHMGMEQK